MTIVGTINLGTAGGEAHMGSFYGKDVVVAAAAVVQHTRYQGIASVNTTERIRW